MKNEKLSKICNTFLWLGPLLDVLTALMITKWNLSLTIGVIVRFLYLLFLMIYLLFMKEKEGEKKKTILGLLFFFLYCILFLGINWNRKGSLLLLEMKELLRSFYFPLLLFTLFRIAKTIPLKLKISSFSKLYFVYLLLIAIPNLFGIGLDSYAVTKKGSIGFFYSANEISAILSILMPFFLIFLYQKENILLTAVSFFLLVYVLLSIGTKGPLLSFGILGVLFGIFLIKKWIREKRWKILSSFSLGLVVFSSIFLFFFPKTNFYKNIEVHLQFLEVDSVFEVLKEPHLIDHFIFSSRLSFWEESAIKYKKAPILEKLFGLGYTEEKMEVKMIEMDPLDIFYRHGMIGFILYFGIVSMVFISIFKKYRKTKKTKETLIFGSSLFLIILLSFFTGHILLAPAVSIYVTYLLIYLYFEKENLYETCLCDTQL